MSDMAACARSARAACLLAGKSFEEVGIYLLTNGRDVCIIKKLSVMTVKLHKAP